MPVFNDTKILGDLFVAGETNLVKTKSDILDRIKGVSSTINISNKDSSTRLESIALGVDAEIIGNYSTSLGYKAVAEAYSVALGNRAHSLDGYSVAVGYGASTSEDSIAIGYMANAGTNNSIAIGFGAFAEANNSIAIGYGATTEGNNSIAIGNNTVAVDNVVALGPGDQTMILMVGNREVNLDPFSPVVTYNTTGLTLGLTHSGKTIMRNIASGLTVSIPTNASVAFPVGTEIHFYRRFSSEVIVKGTNSTVVLNGTAAGSVSISDQYKFITIKKMAANEWAAFGALS